MVISEKMDCRYVHVGTSKILEGVGIDSIDVAS